MKNKDFYNLKDIYNTEANYNILLGERSNGKSYAVKENFLYIAYHEKDPYTQKKVTDYQFAYLRRWDLELKGASVEGYFSDMVQDTDGSKKINEITGGTYDCISVWQKKIYFAKYDDENGKIKRGKLIGYAFCLTGETHYKSMSYPLIGRMVFEEFITDSGYLLNEPKKVLDLTSTIFRRRFGRVFLVGNTISRSCPYFMEWQLTNTLRQKPGTIDIYKHLTGEKDEAGEDLTVIIAVERCESTGKASKMFFGHAAKMITRGEWDSEEQPKLSKRFEEYERIYTMFIEFRGLVYMLDLLLDGDNPLIYVRPHTTEIRDRDNTRIITDRYSLSPWHSRGFLTNKITYDNIIVDLIRRDKMAFSDNLTGTEFKALMKEIM